MALAKVGRKLKRTGKDAYKFEFSVLCEHLALQLKPEVKKWSPYKLLVSFSRGHRKVETAPVFFKSVVESGKEGDASWNPPAELKLLVTLYRTPDAVKFDEKEYKFEVVNISKDGDSKLLAVFYADMAQYVKEDDSESVLSMGFKPQSVKISTTTLDATIKVTLVKKGKAGDDDMMSTASRVSTSDLRDLNEELGEDDDDMAQPKLSKKEDKEMKKTLKQMATEQENDPGAKKSAVADWLGVSQGPEADNAAAMLQAESRFADAILITRDDKAESVDRLLRAAVIGVYFSAEWCPPCREFIPKLKEYYKTLKEKGASFEVLWVSSDKNEQSMMRYARSMEMPWPILQYEHPLGNELRDSFEVNSIPNLCFVDTVGNKLEHHGRPAVEKAVESHTAWSSYNLALSKVSSSVLLTGAKPLAEPAGNGTAEQGSVGSSEGSQKPDLDADLTSPKKGGLLTGVKSLVKRSDKDKEKKEAKKEEKARKKASTAAAPAVTDPASPQAASETSSCPTSPETEPGKARHKVSNAHAPSKESKEKKGLMDRLKSSTTQIDILELENKALKLETMKQKDDNRLQTERVDELQLLVQDLRQQAEIAEVEKAKLEKQIVELNVRLSLKGWLSKRGIQGPTKNVYRRRYFELADGGMLNYYTEHDEMAPRGSIDLNAMSGVQESMPEQTSEATAACFKLVTQSRTYELMARDRTTMTRWINALDTYHTMLKSKKS